MVEQFHTPATVREALNLKRRLAFRAAYLAGGTLANAKDSPLRPDHWISLAGLKLDRIDLKRGELVIGALCSLQRVVEDAGTPDSLRAAVAQIASRNVRNMATIGGHVAANLPYSDLIPMLAALDARVELTGPRVTKTVPVMDYITTAVMPGGATEVGFPAASEATSKITSGCASGCTSECTSGCPSGVSSTRRSGKNGLVTNIIVPRSDRSRVAACGNIRGSSNARSLLSAAVSLTLTDLAIHEPIIALGGVGPHVVRLRAAEEALDGKPLPSTDKLAAMISRCVRATSTPFASAPYIRHQAGVVVALAFQKALRSKGDRG